MECTILTWIIFCHNYSFGSFNTGITDSTGKATVTVSVSATTTFTCSYSNVTDTCTVTAQSYLFYDACDSSAGLTNYGQVVPISSETTTSYLSYDSTQNAYDVRANGNWGVIPISVLNGEDDYKITGEFKTRSSNNASQGGFLFRAENSTDFVVFRMYGSSCNSNINDSNQQSIGSVSANSKWYKFEVTKEGTSFEVTVTDIDAGTVVGTQSRTVSFDTYYVGFQVVAGSSYGSYVREVKVVSL